MLNVTSLVVFHTRSLLKNAQLELLKFWIWLDWNARNSNTQHFWFWLDNKSVCLLFWKFIPLWSTTNNISIWFELKTALDFM